MYKDVIRGQSELNLNIQMNTTPFKYQHELAQDTQNMSKHITVEINV